MFLCFVFCENEKKEMFSKLKTPEPEPKEEVGFLGGNVYREGGGGNVPIMWFGQDSHRRPNQGGQTDYEKRMTQNERSYFIDGEQLGYASAGVVDGGARGHRFRAKPPPPTKVFTVPGEIEKVATRVGAENGKRRRVATVMKRKGVDVFQVFVTDLVRVSTSRLNPLSFILPNNAAAHATAGHGIISTGGNYINQQIRSYWDDHQKDMLIDHIMGRSHGYVVFVGKKVEGAVWSAGQFIKGMANLAMQAARGIVTLIRHLAMYAGEYSIAIIGIMELLQYFAPTFPAIELYTCVSTAFAVWAMDSLRRNLQNWRDFSLGEVYLVDTFDPFPSTIRLYLPAMGYMWKMLANTEFVKSVDGLEIFGKLMKPFLGGVNPTNLYDLFGRPEGRASVTFLSEHKVGLDKVISINQLPEAIKNAEFLGLGGDITTYFTQSIPTAFSAISEAVSGTASYGFSNKTKLGHLGATFVASVAPAGSTVGGIVLSMTDTKGHVLSYEPLKSFADRISVIGKFRHLATNVFNSELGVKIPVPGVNTLAQTIFGKAGNYMFPPGDNFARLPRVTTNHCLAANGAKQCQNICIFGDYCPEHLHSVKGLVILYEKEYTEGAMKMFNISPNPIGVCYVGERGIGTDTSGHGQLNLDQGIYKPIMTLSYKDVCMLTPEDEYFGEGYLITGPHVVDRGFPYNMFVRVWNKHNVNCDLKRGAKTRHKSHVIFCVRRSAYINEVNCVMQTDNYENPEQIQLVPIRKIQKGEELCCFDVQHERDRDVNTILSRRFRSYIVNRWTPQLMVMSDIGVLYKIQYDLHSFLSVVGMSALGTFASGLYDSKTQNGPSNFANAIANAVVSIGGKDFAAHMGVAGFKQTVGMVIDKFIRERHVDMGELDKIGVTGESATEFVKVVSDIAVNHVSMSSRSTYKSVMRGSYDTFRLSGRVLNEYFPTLVYDSIASIVRFTGVMDEMRRAIEEYDAEEAPMMTMMTKQRFITPTVLPTITPVPALAEATSSPMPFPTLAEATSFENNQGFFGNILGYLTDTDSLLSMDHFGSSAYGMASAIPIEKVTTTPKPTTAADEEGLRNDDGDLMNDEQRMLQAQKDASARFERGKHWIDSEGEYTGGGGWTTGFFNMFGGSTIFGPGGVMDNVIGNGKGGGGGGEDLFTSIMNAGGGGGGGVAGLLG